MANPITAGTKRYNFDSCPECGKGHRNTVSRFSSTTEQVQCPITREWMNLSFISSPEEVTPRARPVSSR